MTNSPPGAPRIRRMAEIVRVDEVLRSIGEAAYDWDLRNDQLLWSEHAQSVLAVSAQDDIATGRRYAWLLDPENVMTPYNAIMSSTELDHGEGVRYQIEYALHPLGRDHAQKIWIEDCGRWFAGNDGRPKRAHGLVRVITDRRERDQTLTYLTRYDAQTGLYNRAAFAEALGTALERAVSEQRAYVLIIAAIDNLAMVNNAYGFDVADNVIREVGKRLREVTRRDDVLARHSGNKFGVLLPDCDERRLEETAKRLMQVVRGEPLRTQAGPISATISLGAVIIPDQAKTPQRAIACAQDALDEAKNKHRDNFVRFHKSLRRESVRRRNIQLADDILSALNDSRIEAVYQPIVEAKTGDVAFYETLVRMRLLNGTLMSAAQFMSAAEKLALSRLIDHRVLDLASTVLNEHSDIRLSINISAATMDDHEWLEHLRSLFQTSSVDPRQVIIEITETMAIEDLEESNRFVGKLRDMGCWVAIDDFGAGYTSFRNLRHLNVDMVKIDGGFINQLSKDRDNQFFVRSLIDLALNFDLLTVAELVSSEAEADLLVSWGINYLQGYLYGHPQPTVAPTTGTLTTSAQRSVR